MWLSDDWLINTPIFIWCYLGVLIKSLLNYNFAILLVMTSILLFLHSPSSENSREFGSDLRIPLWCLFFFPKVVGQAIYFLAPCIKTQILLIFVFIYLFHYIPLKWKGKIVLWTCGYEYNEGHEMLIMISFYRIWTCLDVTGLPSIDCLEHQWLGWKSELSDTRQY